MDFRILIDADTGNVTTSGTPPQQPQTPPGTPSAPPPSGSPSSSGSTAPGLVEFGGAFGKMVQEAKAEQEQRRKQHAAVSEAMDPSAKVAQQLAEEQLERGRSIAALKERHKLDTAAMEASRLFEEDTLLRQRMLDVTRERHRLEGAAAEEARLYLEGQKESRDWAKKVEAEKRRQDPGSAAADDVGTLGGLVSQLSGGTGAGGWLGGLMQKAPALWDQFGGMFGKGEPVTPAADAAKPGGGGSPARPTMASAADQAKPDYAAQLGKLPQMGSQLQQAGKGAGQLSNLMGGGEVAAGGVEGITALAGGAEAGGAAMAGGGAAAGLLGGAAAAAGPVGIAVAAAVGAAELMKEAARQTTEEWKHWGELTRGIVKDDYLGTLSEAAHDAAGSMTSVLGRGGLVWGLAADVGAEYVKQWGERLKVISGIQDEFLGLGKKIGAYSGALTSAQANAEVRGLMGDMRESENLSESIGRLTDAQSKTTDALRDLFGPIKKLALEGVTIPQEIIAELLGRERQALQALFAELNRRIADMAAEARRAATGLDAIRGDTTLTDIARVFGRNTGVRAPGGRPIGEVPADPANFRGQ